MIKAIIDAPRVKGTEGEWRPDYGGGFSDVTGAEWWGNPPRLGSNYAGVTVNYIMIEIKVADNAALTAIDAQTKHHVYWSEEILEEGETPGAVYRKKESTPDANAWGNFRSKMALRGFSQVFIDTYFDKREIMWGQHDHNGRQGYVGWIDIEAPEEEVSIPEPD